MWLYRLSSVYDDDRRECSCNMYIVQVYKIKSMRMGKEHQSHPQSCSLHPFYSSLKELLDLETYNIMIMSNLCNVIILHSFLRAITDIALYVSLNLLILLLI